MTFAARGPQCPGRSRPHVHRTTQVKANAKTHAQYGPAEIVALNSPIHSGLAGFVERPKSFSQ